ncbi:MAG: glycosyltransferase family 4 protein [Isosphaeraceae bacterium]
MRLLALSSYPVEAAATRYRLVQYVAALAVRGITLEIRPFLDSKLFASLYRRGELARTSLGLLRAGIRRLGDVFAARNVDVVFVQREAMIFGPPLIEWLAKRLGNCPLVLDLDDATYISYSSPTYGHLGKVLKWPGKTDRLIRWASVVTCGNRTIADYVRSKGTESVVIPTVVDTDRFRPATRSNGTDPSVPVIGWIGTHSTYPYLESIFPALQDLARSHRFLLKVIGSGRDRISVPGVSVQTLDWSLEREVEDFQSFDIGLYPIVDDGWSAGKSGFKAIQYMAVGIPHVVTPLGACAEIGEPGVTHFCASSRDEWCGALSCLLRDGELRERMGESGRQHAVCHYHLSVQVEILSTLLGQVARKDRTTPSLRETEFLDSRSNCDSQLHQDAEVTP